MKTVIQLLQANPQVSDYKINEDRKESYELFFVKGKLETVRRTDNCDREVTVYVDHGAFRGESKFFVYPSTSEMQLRTLIREAVDKALLIENPAYLLPDGEQGSYEVASNFYAYTLPELAEQIADAVFAADTLENGSLNSVEIFVNKRTETVVNSRGLRKTQTRCTARAEVIPTYNGANLSVELYEDYVFAAFDPEKITARIAGRLAEAKARYEAVKPDFPMAGAVILDHREVFPLFWSIADDLDYASVYGKYNLFQKGDAVQKTPRGDRIGITMAGQVPGSISARAFDADGVSLDQIRLVEDGKAVNYFGSNRYGQYLNLPPTGVLPCLLVDAGTAEEADFAKAPCLEIISMSGLQVDLCNDYIGGEVRLAFWHDGEKKIPVTGISVSGKLSQVLNGIRLSAKTGIHVDYTGPERVLLEDMQIF